MIIVELSSPPSIVVAADQARKGALPFDPAAHERAASVALLHSSRKES